MIRIPKLLVLNVTSDCNMRCKYCYAAAGERREYMSTQTALLMVDEMIRINRGHKINLLFHGGEPLLCYDLVKEVVEYCECAYPGQVDLFIQTNAILLDEDAILFFKRHNVKISISVDGDSVQSNAGRILKNGENSFKQIDQAIQIASKNDVCVTALAVLNKNNVNSIEHIIDYFAKNGIFSFSFNYFIKGGRGQKNKELALDNGELFNVTVKIIEQLEKYHKEGVSIMDRNVYFLINTILTKKKNFMCACSPCGAGLNLIGITPFGDVYPCDDLSGILPFRLGNINEKKLESIMESNVLSYFAMCHLDMIDDCGKCEFNDRCGAGCCSRKFYDTGDIYSKDGICGFYKRIIPYIERELSENHIQKKYYL